MFWALYLELMTRSRRPTLSWQKKCGKMTKRTLISVTIPNLWKVDDLYSWFRVFNSPPILAQVKSYIFILSRKKNIKTKICNDTSDGINIFMHIIVWIHFLTKDMNKLLSYNVIPYQCTIIFSNFGSNISSFQESMQQTDLFC